jgi:WD40 repeat protein|eukprot:COSAG02_NODE_6611_length_3461_cov_2.567222_4_plen_152_part_00
MFGLLFGQLLPHVGRFSMIMYRYEDALGVKCVSWSPSGQLLSIGSYDEKLRVLNHMTWKTLAEHDHTQTKVDGRSVDVYREHTFYDGETERTRYAVEDSTVVVPTEAPDAARPFPKLGVGMQAWSSDSALVFTRNDNAPTALWVWETVRPL